MFTPMGPFPWSWSCLSILSMHLIFASMPLYQLTTPNIHEHNLRIIKKYLFNYEELVSPFLNSIYYCSNIEPVNKLFSIIQKKKKIDISFPKVVSIYR